MCKFLGDISYPLYLVHYPIVYFYVAWISNHQGMTLAQAWPYALLILIVSILLAYISLKWYDEPLRRWLKIVDLPRHSNEDSKHNFWHKKVDIF
ncbi:hypothetical protein [Sphingobacterium sp. E70]|uniref:hypothetical protein n=1 Tax=Sphingobacterium sp. E70 TaxID=2853439 RepID=UPI00359C70B6